MSMRGEPTSSSTMSNASYKSNGTHSTSEAVLLGHYRKGECSIMSHRMRTRQGPTARTLTALAWYMKVLPKRSRKDSRRWPRL